MVVNARRHQKADNVRYRKMLNKKDPFDQLILELGKTGVLDVSMVGIGGTPSPPQPEDYTRKSLPQKGKHTS